ncbi:tRNA (guanosine(46)-N7)-methyltransferase TrmB, partial [Patescibacteria group bacterium]|nr:tRNA (guanosine(46)-N7)-methyltransferase TrmB [Patescibacteria group bacterium]
MRFIRGIIHHLDRWFAEGEIDEIRIIHPDPRSKPGDAKRRLTSPRFLKMYRSLLVPGGKVRVKTDDQDLFAFSLESFAGEGRKLIAETRDLHSSPLLADHMGIITDYEQLALD